MVRLIPVERRGKTVWIEDAPDTCPDGHRQLVPTWSSCPQCGAMGRQWHCRADGCKQVMLDDEHEHQA